MSHTNNCFYLHNSITTNEQNTDFIANALATNDFTVTTVNEVVNTTKIIGQFIDARNMACPMPLLKTKVALRELADDNWLYLVATDANSQHDIKAYAKFSQLELLAWSSTNNDTDKALHHFLLRPLSK